MGLPCDWQLTKQKISQRGKHLLETGQWADCKFLVGQEPHQQVLEGHTLVLAMSSPVFEAMFFGGMAEKNVPIPIRDVQPEAFKALLEYIYTDNVDLGSFELACELCYCAKKYMLPYLVEECTKYLWSDLSPKKACRAYEFAKLFEEPVLMDKCLQIICTETSSVLKESSWEEVELATLTTMFEQSELQISSEIELFGALERWAKAECSRKSLDSSDTKSLKSVVGNALSKIRFLSLTPQEFAEGPGRSSLLTQDEVLAILMNILCTGNKTPMPEGFSIDSSSRAKPNRGFNAMCKWGSANIPSTTMRDNSFGYSNTWERVGGPRTDQGANLSWNSDMPNTRDKQKYYCVRPWLQQTDYFNPNVMDCSVTFSVDKDISILGVQVPAQIAGAANNLSQLPIHHETTYTEVLYAHLLDSNGSRLSYTHFATKVDVGDLVEITFNHPIVIKKQRIYRVGVVFNTVGWYSTGGSTQRITCDNVSFSFGVGNNADNIRDGMIRSIVYTLQ